MAINNYHAQKCEMCARNETIYDVTIKVALRGYYFLYFFYCHFARPFLDIFGKPVFSRFRHFFAKNKKKLCSQI